MKHILKRENVSVELGEHNTIGFAFPERNERPFMGPDFSFAHNRPLAVVLSQETLSWLQPNVFRKIRPPELPYVVYGVVHELPFFWACDCGPRVVYLECRTDLLGTQIATETDLRLRDCGEHCPWAENALSAPAELLLCCAVQSAS